MKKALVLALLFLAGPLRPAFATWDATTPSGTEAKSLGDDRIREFKTDVQTALDHEGSFPGSDTANPKFIWTPSTGTTAQRDAIVTANKPVGKVFINKSSATVEQWNGASWDVLATFIPTGTKMVFFQAGCPTGWTQDASQNDKAMRVVSGTGAGTGGTNAMSTGLAHSHTVNAHTHTTPAHQHLLATEAVNAAATLTVGGDYLAVTSGGTNQKLGVYTTGVTNRDAIRDRTTDNEGSGTSGSASPGTDSQSPTFQYIDVIVCSKN